MMTFSFATRHVKCVAFLLTACALLTSSAFAAPAGGNKGFSDAAVADSIKRAQKFLWSKQGPEGDWGPFNLSKDRAYEDGPTALAVYALLASGVSAAEPRMIKALDWMAKKQTDLTYSLGLRCNVWYLANKETQHRYRRQLRQDVKLLLHGHIKGGYDYHSTSGKSGGRTDNSNSQYGVLGAWAAALADEEIPSAYWRLVMAHWNKCQGADGGWGYAGNNRGASTATMTAGGLATLFVCFDNLLYAKFTRCKVDLDFKQLEKGLAWMNANFTKAVNASDSDRILGHGDSYYFLYGMERVGLACGYKYFGTADWYKLGAQRMLARQRGDGAWAGQRGEIVSTAFATLFLARGQHAVAFNKLEFKGDWNNRPRDLAQLTRWISGSFERTLNWQVINLKVPVEQWHDAPILYLSASDAPEFSDEHLKKIKRYIDQGGTILSATECGGKGFREGIREIYKKILPNYALEPMPTDHAIYTAQFKLRSVPPLSMIHNGIRPLVLHTDADLPKSWQIRNTTFAKGDFEIAANALMYVTDMGQLRNRGVSHWPKKPSREPADTIKLARVRYKGNWNPEPAACERFGMLLTQQTGLKIEIEAVPLEALGDCDAPVACMTGTEAVRLTEPQKMAVKKYVAKGGLLLVDAAGGSREFGDRIEPDLAGIFDQRFIRRLSSENAVYKLKGNEIESVSYRRKARLERGLKHDPDLRGIEIDGRVGVIFSRHDLTGGLLGIPMYDCAGYNPDSAFKIMRNVILYAIKDRKPPAKAKPADQKPKGKKKGKAKARK